MKRPGSNWKSKTLRSSVQDSVTRAADRNHVKPVLYGVAAMVVIFLGWFATTNAPKSSYMRKFSQLYSIVYSGTGSPSLFQDCQSFKLFLRALGSITLALLPPRNSNFHHLKGVEREQYRHFWRINGVYQAVTLYTDGHDVKPMRLTIPVMVMIVARRVSAVDARKSLYAWEFSDLHSNTYGNAGLIFLWVCLSVFLGGCAPSFGMFTPPRLSLFGVDLVTPPAFDSDFLGLSGVPFFFNFPLAYFTLRTTTQLPAGVFRKLIQWLWSAALSTNFFYKIKHGDTPFRNSPCYNHYSLCCAQITAWVRAGRVVEHAFGSISFSDILSQNRYSIKNWVGG